MRATENLYEQGLVKHCPLYSNEKCISHQQNV